MVKGLRAKLLSSIDYIEAASQVVRVSTDAPVTLSTPTDVLPLVAADPKRTAELATELGVGRRSPVCRKRSTPTEAADLVGALAVLEGHCHVLRAPSILTLQSTSPPS